MNLSTFFKDKIILVIGGTGSIGSEITNQLLKLNPKTIRILTNSENELWEMKQRYKNTEKKLRFLLGDIRDFERIKRATDGVNFIFNAAAIKHVQISEYNPMEAIDVNIHGLENVLKAAFICNAEKLIHISSDKAVNPTTVMGATKMLGERLCLSRYLTRGKYRTIVSCVRFGNVLGSRGSVIPLVKNQIKKERAVTLTDEKMKRFFISISQAVELVLKSAVLSQGGEIFVLKMPTINIKDLLTVIIEEYCLKIGRDPFTIETKIIGPRFGEKLNEELISSIEFSSCYENEEMYIIYPLKGFGDNDSRKIERTGNKLVKADNFYYSTEGATPLTKDEIKEFLKKFNLI